MLECYSVTGPYDFVRPAPGRGLRIQPKVLDDEVARVARSFAACGPNVMRQQKRLLREWAETDLDTAIRNGVNEFAKAFETGEPARYMAPFLKH